MHIRNEIAVDNETFQRQAVKINSSVTQKSQQYPFLNVLLVRFNLKPRTIRLKIIYYYRVMQDGRLSTAESMERIQVAGPTRRPMRSSKLSKSVKTKNMF